MERCATCSVTVCGNNSDVISASLPGRGVRAATVALRANSPNIPAMTTEPKPFHIVYARPPHKRSPPSVPTALTGVRTITATKPGKQRQAHVDSPDDREADARVKAFFARMIPPSE
jgi:hypothetical protein